MSIQLSDWFSKGIVALIPIMLGALTTLAWQNSHGINAIGVRLEAHQREIDYNRRLIEDRMGCGRADNDRRLQH